MELASNKIYINKIRVFFYNTHVSYKREAKTSHYSQFMSVSESHCFCSLSNGKAGGLKSKKLSKNLVNIPWINIFAYCSFDFFHRFKMAGVLYD